jgi:hypothetical protein
VARLFADDRQVDEQHAPRMGAARLRYGKLTVVVVWWWLGRVARCVLVDPSAEGKIRKLSFAPPPHTAAAKLAKWKAAHPQLYASRHVVLAVLEILGLSALIGALLPRIPWRLPKLDLSWLPDIDLPNIWGWLPRVDLPNLAELADYKWVVLLVIAVGVAVAEVHRNKRKRHHDSKRPPP